MPGFDGTGPYGMGPRLGYCFGLGSIVNIALLGLGIYTVGKLIFNPSRKVNQ